MSRQTTVALRATVAFFEVTQIMETVKDEDVKNLNEEVPQHCRASDILYQFYERQYFLRDKKGSKKERNAKLDLLSKKIFELYNRFMDEESIYRKVSTKDQLIAFNRTIMDFQGGKKHIYVTTSTEANFALKQLSRMLHTSDDNILRVAIFDTLDVNRFIKEDDVLYNNMLQLRELIEVQLDQIKGDIDRYYETIKAEYSEDE